MFDGNEDKTEWTFRHLEERLKPFDPKDEEKENDEENIFSHARYTPPHITPYSDDTEEVAVKKLKENGDVPADKYSEDVPDGT
eukprot:TRINITY_DN4565_c0_g1_i3.p2 TRINITY_DN4565_c0_g1~~TRINITY_DN4565_c0_g1_i3.p2  ORF type:complete len:83 (-),score=26.27 TRINITY_DN4565_c0_g1_i3:209-457(-)